MLVGLPSVVLSICGVPAYSAKKGRKTKNKMHTDLEIKEAITWST